MNRWHQQFQGYPFQSLWKQLKETTLNLELPAEATDIDQHTEEFTRFRKLLNFIDGLLKKINPELIHRNLLGGLQNYANICDQSLAHYIQNKQLSNLQEASLQLEEILVQIRIYPLLVETAPVALETLEQSIKDVSQQSVTLRRDVTSTARSIAKINDFEEYLFEGRGDKVPLKNRVEALYQEITEKQNKIDAFFKKLTAGNGEAPSLIQDIEAKHNTINTTFQEVTDHRKAVGQTLKELEEFHERIFGIQHDDDEFPEGGLKQELDAHLKHLETFKAKQEEKYNDLYEKIEGLLAGATSAGLASAYDALKKDTEKKSETYTKWFFILLGLLFGVSVIPIEGIRNFLSHSSEVLSENRDPVGWVWPYISKISLIFPILWGILFTSQRRSEFHRLTQEYAHKAAMARSFEGFKKQIATLNNGEEDKLLMKQLLEATITAISFNASTTLDGKHGDKLPLQTVIEKTIDSISKKIIIPITERLPSSKNEN